MMAPFTPHEAARALGGKVDARGVSFRSPGHSAHDCSARILFGPQYPGGWWVKTWSPADDAISVRAFVAATMHVEARPPRPEKPEDRARREAARRRSERQAAADERRRIRRAVELWDEAKDPRNTIVEAYLNSRRLGLPDEVAGHVLRFHPRCPWKADEDGPTVQVPAMIGAMRHVETDELRAIHRTVLSPAGEKIGRKMLGPAAGTAIKLFNTPTDADLVAGEGIESCLAARVLGFGPRIWAMGAAGGIDRFPVINGVSKLVLLEERDDNGASSRAVRRCAARWEAAGREALAVLPRMGSDMNDVLLMGGA